MLIAFASDSNLYSSSSQSHFADNNKFIEPSIFILVSRVAFREYLYVSGKTSIFISNTVYLQISST